MNDAKLKSAIEKLKSAVGEVESCMNAGSEPEAEESEEMPKLSEIDVKGESDEEAKPSDEKEGKKAMVMAMMKKKGY